MLSKEILNELMQETINEASRSKPEDQGVHPKVGAIISDRDGKIIQRAHRGEEKGCHAEYLCIKKAKNAGQNLEDCILFVTLEPCTARGPGKKACATHIIESGIKKIYIGMLDPNPAICGKGETRLRFHLEVERFPSSLIRKIETMNYDFIELHKKAHLAEESLYVKMQIHSIMSDILIRNGIPIDGELPIDVNMTSNDICKICLTKCFSEDKKDLDINILVQEARSKAYDKKYADRSYDNDGRGLGNYWKSSVQSILDEMSISNFYKRKILVVGIGNGLEGKELYLDCENLTAVDIGEKSLKRAGKILPKAKMIKTEAENLHDIATNSQDIYISLRTYQSTYFDRAEVVPQNRTG